MTMKKATNLLNKTWENPKIGNSESRQTADSLNVEETSRTHTYYAFAYATVLAKEHKRAETKTVHTIPITRDIFRMDSTDPKATEARHLRDCITILQENIPKKRKRLVTILDQHEEERKRGNHTTITNQQTNTDSIRPDITDNGVGHELVQEERKACLKELLPVLICGPLVAPIKVVAHKTWTKEEAEQAEAVAVAVAVDLKTKGSEEKALNATTTVKSKSLEKQKEPEEEEKEKEEEDPLMCYKKRLEELKQDNAMLQQRRRDAFESYAGLISKYEYGLNYISNLGSLAESPDNVMYGNFTTELSGTSN
jgi:hypothetical protein